MSKKYYAVVDIETFEVRVRTTSPAKVAQHLEPGTVWGTGETAESAVLDALQAAAWHLALGWKPL